MFYQGDFVDYASTSLFVSDLLIIGLLLLWLADCKRNNKFSWGPRWLTVPLILLAGWMWVSLIWAEPSGWIGVQSAARFSLYVGLYLYVVNRVTDVRELVYPTMIGMVSQAGIAMGQYFSNHSLGLKWLGESVLDPVKSGIPVVLIDGVRQLRAHGTLSHANVLGGYLAMGLVMMWPLLFSRGKLISNVIYWIVVGVSLVGLVLSLSRSAWIVFVGGGVIAMAWLAWKHRDRLWVGLRVGWPIILVVTTVVISQWQAIVPRWSASPDALEQISVDSRIKQWGEFKQVYHQHALTGVGIGQYFLHIWQPGGDQQEASQTPSWQYRSDLGGWGYSTTRSLSYYQPVHDVYLLALAELGPLGLGLWLWLMIAAAYLATRLAWDRLIAGVAGLWAILVVAGVALVDHYFWTLPAGRLIVILVLGYIAVLWVNPGYNGRDGRAKSQSKG